MKNPHRVVWTKGMFLNPQHFQAQDQAFEDALHFRVAASHYANWGVRSLDIDSEALASGTFRLNEASGIMPDGLVFRMPQVDALPPSREIEGFFPATATQASVYLAIPETRANGSNVAIDASGRTRAELADTRYSAEPRTVADYNEGKEDKTIQVARKNFRLLFDEEHRDGFVTIRMAQIVRDATGGYQLKPTHIAPCVDIGHNAYLMDLLRRQVEILNTKRESLSGTRRERGADLADFTASEVSNLWMLHTINFLLPELKHLWKVRRGHPEPVYLVLAKLAGALSTFSVSGGTDELPDYDHNDLNRCFGAVDDQIRRLVETVVRQGYTAVPFTKDEQGIWTAGVPDAQLRDGSRFFLAVSAAMDAGRLISDVPDRVRVAASDEIFDIIAKALRGIPLTHAPSPPAVPMKLGNQYFEMGQSGGLWQRVKDSGTIAVSTGSLPEPKLELVIVKTRGRE